MKWARTKLISVLILIFMMPLLLAQEATETKDSERNGSLPYEVVITADVKYGALKKLQVQIEDDFFAKFNELNLDDDYDVMCYRFKPTGSHISRRVCEPKFFMDARAANASEVMFVIACNCPAAPPPLENRRGIRAQTGSHFDILQEKLDTFYRNDPELNAIGEALGEVKLRIKNF